MILCTVVGESFFNNTFGELVELVPLVIIFIGEVIFCLIIPPVEDFGSIVVNLIGTEPTEPCVAIVFGANVLLIIKALLRKCTIPLGISTAVLIFDGAVFVVFVAAIVVD